MTDSENQHGFKTALHLVLLLLIFVLWIVTGVLAVTPNNRLYAMGLGNAIAIDLTLGVLFALGIAVTSIVYRATCPLSLFVVIQLLAWAHAVGIWLLMFVAAFLYGASV